MKHFIVINCLAASLTESKSGICAGSMVSREVSKRGATSIVWKWFEHKRCTTNHDKYKKTVTAKGGNLSQAEAAEESQKLMWAEFNAELTWIRILFNGRITLPYFVKDLVKSGESAMLCLHSEDIHLAYQSTYRGLRQTWGSYCP